MAPSAGETNQWSCSALFLINASLHSLQPIFYFFYLYTFRFISCAGLECAVYAPVSEDDQWVPLCFLLPHANRIKFRQPWPGWYCLPSTVLSDKQEQPVSLPPFLTQHLWVERWEPSKRLANMPRCNHHVQWRNVTGNVAHSLPPPCVFRK